MSGSDWQPIETAPKDGSEFLAYGEDINGDGPKIGLSRWRSSKEEHWEAVGDRKKELRERDTSAWDYDADIVFPTHWMPLPAPPGADPGIPVYRHPDATDEFVKPE